MYYDRSFVYAGTAAKEGAMNHDCAVGYASEADIDAWMELVALVRDAFPGLSLGEYRENLLKAIAERERPEIVSFGDSETMHATGIVGWLRGDGRWKLLDGFDPAMSYPERLEIRRQALMSDLFITGVNAISMEGSLHWLDKVGNRIAPVAFGPRKVVIVAGRNKIVADRAQAEDRIRTIAAPQNVARHPGFRTPCARTGVCSDCNSPDRVCNTRMEMLRCWPAGRVLVVLIDQELGL